MKLENVAIVQAQPDYFTVYDLEESSTIEVMEPIIAWRIETYKKDGAGELLSTCLPLTVDGDACSNCIGVQNPDGTITTFDDTTFASLEELQSSKYPNA